MLGLNEYDSSDAEEHDSKVKQVQAEEVRYARHILGAAQKLTV